MGKRIVSKTSFNGGVQSPLIRGMSDAPRGNSSFQASNNMIPMKYGPIARRGGTELVAESLGDVGDSKRNQLVPFNYNDEQAYILEFSATVSSKIKVYKDKAVVLNSSATVNRGINGIPAVTAGNDIVVEVDGDGTTYTTGAQVVLTGLTEAVHLEGVTGTVISTTTGPDTVTISDFPHLTAETSATGTLSQVYEVAVPYVASDMFSSDGTFLLDVKQYNDVMYICHPDYQTRILTRSGDDSWSISIAEFKKGPFLPDNIDKNKKLDFTSWKSASSTFGSGVADNDYRYCTLTTGLGDKEELGPFDLFVASDVQLTDDRGLPATGGTSTQGSRWISVFVPRYLYHPGNSGAEPKDYRWHFFRIVRFISASQVIVERHEDDLEWAKGEAGYVANPPKRYDRCDFGSDQWALSAFSVSTGFSSVVAIHDGRLVLGKTVTEPDTLHFSASGGFDTVGFDFTTVDNDGEVYDDFGFSANISGGDASPIQWISSASDGLAVGTYNSEGVVGANDRAKGFSPGNVSYRRNTSVGSKSIQPVMIDQSTLFVSRTGLRIHELTYDLATTGQKSPDLTEIAEHVTKTGIIDFAWQREPRDTLWCVLSDGKLVGFTFNQNAQVMAWHQHELGGDNPRVRSVATIPSTDGSTDELWIAVDRDAYVTSGWYVSDVRRNIEVLSDIHGQDTSILDSKHLDAYSTLSQAEVACEMKTNSGQGLIKDINAPSGHPFSVGDIVFCKSITTPDEGIALTTLPTADFLRDTTFKDRFEGHYFRIQSEDTTEFNLETINGTKVEPWDYVPDGYNDQQIFYDIVFQPVSTTLSGLSSYISEHVSLFIDGQQYVDVKVPSTGTLTLPNSLYAANVTVGYPYTSFVELQNIEPSDGGGTIQGRIKRVSQVMVRVLNSLGLEFGPSESSLDTENFDEDQEISEYRSLKSGDYVLDWREGYEQSGTIRLQGDGPYPLQIQSVIAEVEASSKFTSSR